MNNNIAIRFDHVGKMYRLGLVGTGTLGQDLNRWWKMSVLGKEDPYLKIGETNDRSTRGASDFVYALRDITFDVEQGDVVGIIGKNGAGKSTLLKLLSRITSPTTGTIKARGRIASLLEVGTGFHPELTGRENIYMNGSIMGMTRREIDRKLDEIVDFAGIERYLDTPTKRYSSGMTVRLGFAVAAFLEPEILVVDEVLAVGDAEFQKKAIGKMQDVSQGEGRTVLFVSHNMNSVKLLCCNGIVLKNGMIDYAGNALECVDHYLGDNIQALISHTVIETKLHRPKWAADSFYRELEILEVALLNTTPEAVATDEPIVVELVIKRNSSKIKNCQYTLQIDDDADVRIMNYKTDLLPVPVDQDKYKVRIAARDHDLTKGRYQLNFTLGVKDPSKGLKNYDYVQHVLSFEVKYINQAKKNEYLVWGRGWGTVSHGMNMLEVSING